MKDISCVSDCKDCNKHTDIKLARNHAKRVHIMHLQCRKCGKRFGGTFELGRHLSNAFCKPRKFIKVPQYVIDHGLRVSSCSNISELNQAMCFGPEKFKFYDANNKVDNIIIGIACELVKDIKGPILDLGYNPWEITPEAIIWAYSQWQLLQDLGQGDIMLE